LPSLGQAAFIFFKSQHYILERNKGFEPRLGEDLGGGKATKKRSMRLWRPSFTEVSVRPLEFPRTLA
jgi:hypothetical protein